jgi:hypothetical protein
MLFLSKEICHHNIGDTGLEVRHLLNIRSELCRAITTVEEYEEDVKNHKR